MKIKTDDLVLLKINFCSPSPPQLDLADGRQHPAVLSLPSLEVAHREAGLQGKLLDGAQPPSSSSELQWLDEERTLILRYLNSET